MKNWHCASAVPRDLFVRGRKQLHIWNRRPRCAYSLCNFIGLWRSVKQFLVIRFL